MSDQPHDLYIERKPLKILITFPLVYREHTIEKEKRDRDSRGIERFKRVCSPGWVLGYVPVVHRALTWCCYSLKGVSGGYS